jgi:hypothetical protein
VALSAFNSYFAIKHFAEAEFDADRGICIESTEVRDGAGQTLPTTLWTGCYTPRELRLLALQNGLTRVRIHGVEPGHYGPGKPSTDVPEYLLLAERER